MARVSEWQRAASDAVSWHQDQALNTRILLLHPTGPTGFLLHDMEDDKKYKVFLGDPHHCSCKTHKKENVPCKHILWVILKKFRVPRTDALSYQLGLVDRELDTVLNGYYINRPELQKKVDSSKVEKDDEGGYIQREIKDDDVCPICQEEFLGKKRHPVTFCKFGCGQNIHIHCMKVWADHQKSNFKTILECPLCRTDFGPMNKLLEEFNNAKNSLHTVVRTAHDFTCANCRLTPIKGKCYRCRVCVGDVVFCQNCFTMKIHLHHPFEVRGKTGERWKPADRGFLMVGSLGNEIESQLANELQFRDISDNDYETLLQLDEQSSAGAAGSTTTGSCLTDTDLALIPSMAVKKQHAHLLKPGIQCNLCLQLYRVGQSIRRLPCRHKFHQHCVDGYLLHQSDLCPICKEKVEVKLVRSASISGSKAVKVDQVNKKDCLVDLLSISGSGDAARSEKTVQGRQKLPKHRGISTAPSIPNRYDDSLSICSTPLVALPGIPQRGFTSGDTEEQRVKNAARRKPPLSRAKTKPVSDNVTRQSFSDLFLENCVSEFVRNDSEYSTASTTTKTQKPKIATTTDVLRRRQLKTLHSKSKSDSNMKPSNLEHLETLSLMGSKA